MFLAFASSAAAATRRDWPDPLSSNILTCLPAGNKLKTNRREPGEANQASNHGCGGKV